MRAAAFLICLWFGPIWLAAADSGQAEFFESKVRPLLAGCPLGCNFCTTSAFFGGKGKFINFYDKGEELFQVMEELEVIRLLLGQRHSQVHDGRVGRARG